MPDIMSQTPATLSAVDPPTVCIAIFGSRVLPDGSPSGSLRRRIEGAYLCAMHQQRPCFFVTGGTSDVALPTEAAVMARELKAKGVAQNDLIEDHQSHDTLASVLMAETMLSKQIPILVCSDNYHVLRITLLLRMSGFDAKPIWIASGRPANGTVRWCYMWFRDWVATLYDALLLSYHRLKKD